jgi:hypothetical protein
VANLDQFQADKQRQMRVTVRHWLNIQQGPSRL